MEYNVPKLLQYQRNNGNKKIMARHCTALLGHCADRGPIVSTVASLAEECGIPCASLYNILLDAYECKCHSMLFSVSMQRGDQYLFHVYGSFNGRFNGDRLARRIIDVKRVHEDIFLADG